MGRPALRRFCQKHFARACHVLEAQLHCSFLRRNCFSCMFRRARAQRPSCTAASCAAAVCPACFDARALGGPAALQLAAPQLFVMHVSTHARLEAQLHCSYSCAAAVCHAFWTRARAWSCGQLRAAAFQVCGLTRLCVVSISTMHGLRNLPSREQLFSLSMHTSHSCRTRVLAQRLCVVASFRVSVVSSLRSSSLYSRRFATRLCILVASQLVSVLASLRVSARRFASSAADCSCVASRRALLTADCSAAAAAAADELLLQLTSC